MARLSVAAILLAVAALTRAVTPNTPSILPGAYIVEYEDDHDPVSFLSFIEKDATVRRKLDFKLFKGSSIQFKDLEKAEDLAHKVADLPAIKNVWPVKRYPIPQHTVHSTGNVAINEMLAKRQYGNESDIFTPHLMTQVNKFRDSGVTGSGIKVAIVDTGTDYLHPSLGGCFGEGCLVSYGADLVGDSFNGRNAPQPDDDPLDNCNGHGTHVAGIIAAQPNNPFGIVGAASDVTIGSYRVFGCSGDVGNDILIAAYNMAYEDGSDIITASIGGASGWADDPWATVVSRIVENGVSCVVSAGNDGSAGIFYASTAANGRRVTAIASTDNTLAPALLTNASYKIGSQETAFGFTVGEPGSWTNVSLPLWAVSYNTSDPANGCEPFPASTPDLSGYIVLIRRGSCTFVQKIQNAVAKGARYVIFYNNAAGTAVVGGQVDGVRAVAMVTAEQGADWIEALESGDKVSVNMPNPATASKFLANFNNTATSGFLSTYTSWGPTYELDVKPQFSAPGGMILSTYPRALGSYGVLSGTSMACPLAAAVYALIMEARGEKDPRKLENLLASTARPNLFNDGSRTSSLLAPVPQQGAGLIQAWDAAKATTLLSVSSLSFNDTDHLAKTKKFTISNTGDKEVTYALSHVGAATAYTFANTVSIAPASFPNELTDDFASLQFDPSKFKIAPGEEQTVSVSVKPPTGLVEKRLPVYSGYIAINGSDYSALSLPYIGVAGSMRNATVLNTQLTRLSRAADPNGNAVRAGYNFTMAPPGRANDTTYRNQTNLPRLLINLAMGSAFVRVDVVPVGSAAGRNTTTVLGTKTMGQPAGFPSLYNPRGTFDAVWDGGLSDGTYVPAGEYKFAIKALRIFGDREEVDDYDDTESVNFNIRYLSTQQKRNAGQSTLGLLPQRVPRRPRQPHSY